MGRSSQTGGVKPMSIAGRLDRERERLFQMTDEERAFRRQWLKDQQLAPNEPVHVPEMYKATHNPIKRLYRWPLNTLASMLTPVLGNERAYRYRYFTGKILMLVMGAYVGTYYFKYHSNDWTRYGGWRYFKSREIVLEGEPDYPKLSDRTKPSDYATRGFDKCELNL